MSRRIGPSFWRPGGATPRTQPPHPPFPIGVNGLVFLESAAFACNTDRGLLLRIAVTADGRAGEPSVLMQDGRLIGAEGLRVDRNGSLYVANVTQSMLLRLTPRGELETLATASDGLDSPSSLCFGPSAMGEWLYVVDYATLSSGIPGAPARPALLRWDAQVPGFHP